MNLKIAILYTLFAVISTLVNIGTQASIVSSTHHFGMPDGPALAISLIAGTGTGLTCKYILDRNWIFQYQSSDKLDEARAFIVYTIMGIITTLLYLVVELSFHWFFKSDAMRYLGAAIGLAIGYFIKYALDKKYSFKRN